jgi:hypothetical protein
MTNKFTKKDYMITHIANGLIWYEYGGDEIAWNGEVYLSICSGGVFASLQEMDKFLESYGEQNRILLNQR